MAKDGLHSDSVVINVEGHVTERVIFAALDGSPAKDGSKAYLHFPALAPGGPATPIQFRSRLEFHLTLMFGAPLRLYSVDVCELPHVFNPNNVESNIG